MAVDPTHTAAGDDSPMPLCVVVDAQTGRVRKIWKGSIAVAGAPADVKARAAAGTTVLAQYEDAKGRSSSSSSALGNDVYDLLTNGDPFATYDTTGGFFGTHGAPAALGASMPGMKPGDPKWTMRAPIDGSTNAARFFCRVSVLLWCGRNGGRPGLAPGYHRWFFTINWAGPVSKFVSSQERIYLQRGDQSIDEQTHSHEIGHEIDYVSRDDYQDTTEGDEIKEALAEMFSFTYYGFRPGLAGHCSVSELLSGSRVCQIVNGDTGVAETVPHEYKNYGCATDEHTNGYILGRAFLTVLQKIGPDDATRLLGEVPRLLPAKRTFGSVHQAFEDATVALNLTQFKSTVHDAFVAQGVTTSKTRTGTCPNASPKLEPGAGCRADRGSEPLKRPRVLDAVEVLRQHLAEHGRLLRRACEQRHRRVELLPVGRAEDLTRGASAELGQDPRAVEEPWPEERVGEVALGLGQRGDGVPLRGGAPPEPGDLREDEPHPVRRLATGAQLAQRGVVDVLLGGDEAGQVVRIGHLASVRWGTRRWSRRSPLCGLIRRATLPR